MSPKGLATSPHSLQALCCGTKRKLNPFTWWSIERNFHQTNYSLKPDIQSWLCIKHELTNITALLLTSAAAIKLSQMSLQSSINSLTFRWKLTSNTASNRWNEVKTSVVENRTYNCVSQWACTQFEYSHNNLQSWINLHVKVSPDTLNPPINVSYIQLSWNQICMI